MNSDTAVPDTPATLLCVDDEQNILSALKRLFRPAGYRLLTAESGAEALAIMEREPVDLVISDMRMPEMDGATFLTHVVQRWPTTKRILLTGYADLSSTIAAVNNGHIYRYVSKPWEDSDLRLAVQHGLEQQFLERERIRLLELTQNQNAELQDLNANLERKVADRTAELREANDGLERMHNDLKASYVSTVKVFAHLLEMREQTVAGHSRRVADQARRLAQHMNLDPDAVQAVLFAALLHDIGKIALPDQLISKPFNSLPAPEREKVMQHPAVGQGLLMGLDYLHQAAQLIRSHHERWDGQGYPDQLKGAAIPLGARILAVVNDYDALQRGTLATVRFSPAQAREYLTENKSRRYDPAVVDAYLTMLGHEEGSLAVQERAMSSSTLEPGMVLSRDLVTRDGVLLLSAGYVLDKKLIEKIQQFETAVNYQLAVYIAANR